MHIPTPSTNAPTMPSRMEPMVLPESFTWFDTVQLVYTHQFQDYFWPRVGNKAIQALALDAANSVPGQGTTPIRFWGDTSYTGVVG